MSQGRTEEAEVILKQIAKINKTQLPGDWTKLEKILLYSEMRGLTSAFKAQPELT